MNVSRPRPTILSHLRDIWRYRGFLKYETLARLKTKHKGSKLGYIWWLLDPLIFLCIYYLLVKVILKRGGPSYVLFVFCALLPWRWFLTSTMEACTSMRLKGGLIKQVYFPKTLLPVAAILYNTINFSFGLLILIAFLIQYQVVPGPNLGYFPLVMLVQLMFTVGLGLVLADWNVFIRDTGDLLRYLLQMWFFMTPILYSPSMIPEVLRPIFNLNPMSVIVTSYRNVVLYDHAPPLRGLAIVAGVSLLLILFGLRSIARHQGQYAKTI